MKNILIIIFIFLFSSICYAALFDLPDMDEESADTTESTEATEEVPAEAVETAEEVPAEAVEAVPAEAVEAVPAEDVEDAEEVSAEVFDTATEKISNEIASTNLQQTPDTEKVVNVDQKMSELYKKGLKNYILRKYFDAKTIFSKAYKLGIENDGDRKALRKIRKYMAKAEEKYSTMTTFYFEGVQLYEAGNYKEAIKYFKEVLAINPNHNITIEYIEKSISMMTDEEKTEELKKFNMLAKKNSTKKKYDQAAMNYRVASLYKGYDETGNKDYELAYNNSVTLSKDFFGSGIKKDDIKKQTVTKGQIKEKIEIINGFIARIKNKKTQLNEIINDINALTDVEQKNFEKIRSMNIEVKLEEINNIKKEISSLINELKLKYPDANAN